MSCGCGYGYGGCYEPVEEYGRPGGGTLALILVLFILLVIVGGVFFC